MIAIYILLVLLFGGLITFFVSASKARITAIFFSVLSLVLTLCLTCSLIEGKNDSFGFNWISNPNISFALKIDGLSVLMVLLNTFLTTIILLASKNHLFKRANIVYGLVLLMSMAMAGTFLASDGLLYYIFWELSLLPIFFIALLWGNDTWEVRKKAILKFFIYTFAGSLFMLVAFVYLYSKAGSFLWKDLVLTSGELSSSEQTWIYGAFFLAYAIKIPVFPFHTWQANTYEKAPALGTMLLSGIMLKMGLYSVLRWQLPLTKSVDQSVQNIVIILCLIGVVYASLLALKQKHIKRLLAYSSMAHVGLIAAGAYVNNDASFQGVVLQMLAHGLVVVALFYLTELIYGRFGTYQIDEMGGIRNQAIAFCSFFLIFLFASIGLPGTFNFVGEFSLLLGLSKYGIVYALVGGTTIILGAYYMLKMFQKAILGTTNSKQFKDLSKAELFVLSLLAFAVLFFGLFPKVLTDILYINL